MNYCKKLILITVFLSNKLIFPISLWKTKDKPKVQMVYYLLPGLCEAMPYDLCKVIDSLLYKNNTDSFSNRLILYGPPGNGKTKIAEVIAEISESELISIDGSSVVTKYQGSGAQLINEKFKLAMDKALFGFKTVIFVDEVDAIASKNNTNRDHESSVQALWKNLDKVKKNKKIFVIFATNKFDQLTKPLLDRIVNIVEIPNPDEMMRRAIIDYYLNELKISKLTEENKNDLVKVSEGLSNRSIEMFLRKAKNNAVDSLNQEDSFNQEKFNVEALKKDIEAKVKANKELEEKEKEKDRQNNQSTFDKFLSKGTKIAYLAYLIKEFTKKNVENTKVIIIHTDKKSIEKVGQEVLKALTK